jgi:hypothetical protein
MIFFSKAKQAVVVLPHSSMLLCRHTSKMKTRISRLIHALSAVCMPMSKGWPTYWFAQVLSKTLECSKTLRAASLAGRPFLTSWTSALAKIVPMRRLSVSLASCSSSACAHLDAQHCLSSRVLCHKSYISGFTDDHRIIQTILAELPLSSSFVRMLAR